MAGGHNGGINNEQISNLDAGKEEAEAETSKASLGNGVKGFEAGVE